MATETIFQGSGVAIVTPMNSDGSINYDKLGEIIEDQIKNETDAIVVCGTTGESSTMTDDEHREVIKYTVEKVAKRVPVIAGAGSNDTLYAKELSMDAERLGADALLHVSPYYNKTSQRGLEQHFTAIADSVNIPIILYNIPGRTNVNISVDTFVKLSKHPNIIGVKESGGDINYFSEIMNACGDDFHVYSGDDMMTVPAMAIGAKGVISVASNIMPKKMHDLCKLCLENNILEAGKLQNKYNPLFKALVTYDVNPVPIKEAMNIMGYNVGGTRLPLYTMEDSVIKRLKTELEKLELV